MNPDSSFELPPVQSRPEQQAQGMEFAATQSFERTEQAAATAIERQAVGQTFASAQLPDPALVPVASSDPAVPAMPQIADDIDLVEKEWVLKAKEIVHRTKHDPYQQNKEVERMKADYIKKRYNKDIKLTED